MKARVWAGQGRLGEAVAWARERGLSAGDNSSYLREFEHVTLARVLLARARSDRADGSLREATGLLERLLQAADAGGRVGSAIDILVLQALAHEARRDVPAALLPLERALRLAEPEGYVRVFVDEGAPMASLLDVAGRRGIASQYAHRLSGAFARTVERAPVQQNGVIEPPSERELDVLRLLATHLNGPDMARKLVVSLNTLRTHTKNISSKLGVNNRGDAVCWADELGLVHPASHPQAGAAPGRGG
jgi:LuxR family maltose regulon positive regulatory protein